MNIVSDKIEVYIEEHCTEESNVLNEINRKTHLEQLYPQMVSGKVQGQFLKMISRMVKPVSILEIGTFTAYSTICLATGLAPNGTIDTIEISEELRSVIEKNLDAAGIRHQINLYIGEAMEIIPTLNKRYDLVFLDADKDHYPQYYQLLMPLLKKGGFLVADNVLWSGKVLEPQAANDKATKGVIAFNKMVHHDAGVDNVILSARDGWMLVHKN